MSQTAEVVRRGGDQALALLVVAHVAVMRQGCDTGFRGDLARRLLAAVEVDVGQRDPGAVLREGQRAGAADSLSGAGYDGGLAFEEPGGVHAAVDSCLRYHSAISSRVVHHTPGSDLACSMNWRRARIR